MLAVERERNGRRRSIYGSGDSGSPRRPGGAPPRAGHSIRHPRAPIGGSLLCPHSSCLKQSGESWRRVSFDREIKKRPLASNAAVALRFLYLPRSLVRRCGCSTAAATGVLRANECRHWCYHGGGPVVLFNGRFLIQTLGKDPLWG